MQAPSETLLSTHNSKLREEVGEKEGEGEEEWERSGQGE